MIHVLQTEKSQWLVDKADLEKELLERQERHVQMEMNARQEQADKDELTERLEEKEAEVISKKPSRLRFPDRTRTMFWARADLLLARANKEPGLLSFPRK